MRTSIMKLPEWTPPTDLPRARDAILSLGRSLHEHAFLIGQILHWVKSQLAHGQLGPWLNENVWFNERTARRFMAFADACNEAGVLLEYHPKVKTDTVSDLALPDYEHLARLARAYEMLDAWDAERRPLPGEAEYKAIQEECAALNAVDIDNASIDELPSLIDQACTLADRAVEVRLRAERELGKLLLQERDGGRGIMELATIIDRHPATARKLFAERLAELSE